ncbi:MAG: M14 family zinc carboxypeptidase [bacterium]|nr:M14 family zinc carboxypeptidase [bacterium]
MFQKKFKIPTFIKIGSASLLLLLFSIKLSAMAEPKFPKCTFNSNQTPTYAQMRQSYMQLDSASPYMKLTGIGHSDAGRKIELFIVNKQQDFVPTQTSGKRKMVWLIMNGIHPGESEGIDASILFLQAMAKNPMLIPDGVTILVIPAYNVDGMGNRKTFTRANQNGPVQKGFRASANNYDLNRDFIKADSKTTFSFYKIFHAWCPQVFLDTHTSNGADYQYTMTLISTQKDKLGGPAADFLYQKMNPFLYRQMKAKSFEMAPYVNVFGNSPDAAGYEAFVESAKYSTGFAALFGTLGFVAETHMLKPYPNRVQATYALLQCFLQFCAQNSQELVRTKAAQVEWMQLQQVYSSNYVVQKSVNKNLLFNGYELEKLPSQLGNYERHSYNRKRAFQRTILYYDSCYPSFQCRVPKYFVVPQSWQKTIDRLAANGVEHTVVEDTRNFDGKAKYIQEIKYANSPSEGHFVHREVSCVTKPVQIELQAGDWIVPTHQMAIRYIMEVLSPEAWDGFFAWNFFDPILNEKEGFSDYAFEDEALQMLAQNPAFKQKFEDWKNANPDKIGNKYEVLGFLYHNSPYAEAEYRRFPVFFEEK